MICSCCGRECVHCEKHHLIPRTRHRNKKTRKDFSRERMHAAITVCRPCHSQIHAIFTEKELERYYNTLEDIILHRSMIKFVNWIKKKSFAAAESLSPQRKDSDGSKL